MIARAHTTDVVSGVVEEIGTADSVSNLTDDDVIAIVGVM